MKKCVLVAMFLLCALAGGAADSLTRFQEEIDACAAKGGGVVTVPAGLHETAPLELKSNVELHLADGAELLFTDDLAYYDYREWTNETGAVESSVKSLVTSQNATNVAITGRGTLRPRMGRWECWRWFRNRHRPRFVKLMKTKGIRLEGFRLRHSPSWFVHLEECADVTVRGLDIEGYLNNNDGIDVDSTRNVLIEDCRLSVGDDVICMKSGKDAAGRRRGIPTENVLVRRCTADCGHAFLGIGSECSGGIRNVTMEDCVMDGTCAWLLRLKTRPSRGGFMENITMRNVRAKFVTDTAVQITNGYGGSSDGTVVPPTRVDGVRVENVTVREAKKAFFVDSSLGARNVEFRNLIVNGAQAELGAPAAKSIRLETRSASCQVDVRGARVTSLKLRGLEVLWAANPSDHVAGKWAHGGLPVCWPWFSWHTLPSGERRIHGYAADRDFTVKSVSKAADRSELVLGLKLGELELDYRLTLTDRLQIVCTTKNLGATTVPFSAAFHPYFLIGERDRTRILGPDGKDVCDLRREPTDDGFVGNGFRYVIDDPVLGRKVVVSSTASTSCNIWNCSTQWPKGGYPGIDDLPSGTWRRTVSLEPVKNFPDGQINPGETVSLDIAVEAEPLGPTAAIRPGADWRDGTVYVADRKVYEIREGETMPVNDVRYHHLGYDTTLKTAFLLKGRRNVTLDFKGATLLLHGRIQPFVIDGCTNVTVKNVTVKYARSPFTEGEVVAKTDDVLKLKVDKTLFPYEVRDGDCYFMGDGLPAHPSLSSSFAKFYDGKTRENHHTRLVALGRHAKLNPNAPWAKNVRVLEASEEEGLLVFRCAKSFADWPVRTGDRMVMGHEGRSLSNCMMVESRDVRLVNYRILNGYGMGIFPFHCHNLTIDGLRLAQDAESPSIVANLADGIHAFACSGDFIVRDSVIEGTIDDALNVHANFFKVKSAAGDKIVADTGLEPYSTTTLFLPGDRIRVYRGYTLDAAADYTIVATKPIDKKTVEFTVDRPVAAHQALDAIENMSTQCKLTVSNCRFGRSTAHLRFQTRGGVLVEDCESSLMFMLTGDMSYWFESSPCERAVFRNVRFKGPRGKFWIDPQFVPSEKAPYYHGDLVLENCTFETEKAIGAHYVKSVTLKDCARTGGGTLKLELVNCGAVSAPGCEVSSRTEEPRALKAN